jgi:hypothetical protein
MATQVEHLMPAGVHLLGTSRLAEVSDAARMEVEATAEGVVAAHAGAGRRAAFLAGVKWAPRCQHPPPPPQCTLPAHALLEATDATWIHFRPHVSPCERIVWHGATENGP